MRPKKPDKRREERILSAKNRIVVAACFFILGLDGREPREDPRDKEKLRRAVMRLKRFRIEMPNEADLFTETWDLEK